MGEWQWLQGHCNYNHKWLFGGGGGGGGGIVTTEHSQLFNAQNNIFKESFHLHVNTNLSKIQINMRTL